MAANICKTHSKFIKHSVMKLTYNATKTKDWKKNKKILNLMDVTRVWKARLTVWPTYLNDRGGGWGPLRPPLLLSWFIRHVITYYIFLKLTIKTMKPVPAVFSSKIVYFLADVYYIFFPLYKLYNVLQNLLFK